MSIAKKTLNSRVKQIEQLVKPLRRGRAVERQVQTIIVQRANEPIVCHKRCAEDLPRTRPIPIPPRALLAYRNSVQPREPIPRELNVRCGTDDTDAKLVRCSHFVSRAVLRHDATWFDARRIASEQQHRFRQTFDS